MSDAGKGDKSRVRDHDRYRTNYDRIFSKGEFHGITDMMYDRDREYVVVGVASPFRCSNCGLLFSELRVNWTTKFARHVCGCGNVMWFSTVANNGIVAISKQRSAE